MSNGKPCPPAPPSVLAHSHAYCNPNAGQGLISHTFSKPVGSFPSCLLATHPASPSSHSQDVTFPAPPAPIPMSFHNPLSPHSQRLLYPPHQANLAGPDCALHLPGVTRACPAEPETRATSTSGSMKVTLPSPAATHAASPSITRWRTQSVQFK